uniref:Uncharacterized protein n=1 Tax=Steinernema glaseri TaxID=37863 RepID=A0A1I7ZJD1_9BILA
MAASRDFWNLQSVAKGVEKEKRAPGCTSSDPGGDILGYLLPPTGKDMSGEGSRGTKRLKREGVLESRVCIQGYQGCAQPDPNPSFYACWTSKMEARRGLDEVCDLGQMKLTVPP